MRCITDLELCRSAFTGCACDWLVDCCRIIRCPCSRCSDWLGTILRATCRIHFPGREASRWVTANKTSKSFIAATTAHSSVDLLSWILISDISSFAPQLPSFVAGSPEFEMLQKINGVILDISRKMWSASQSCAPDWYGELVDRAWFVSRCLTKLSLLYDRCQAACQQEQEKRYQVSCA